MTSLQQKAEIIRRHETGFAELLSAEVIERPKLSVWLILIPILFVSYLSQLRRYAQGRKDFSKNYLQSKQQALDLAFHALNSGTESTIDPLAGLAGVREDIRLLQAEVQKVLVEHFLALLRADGDDYGALVRRAYRDRTSYLLFLNRLNKAENAVYAVLTEKLTEEGAASAVETVERASERLRRREAEQTFP